MNIRAIYAPSGTASTPAPGASGRRGGIAAALNFLSCGIVAALKQPDVYERITNSGFDPLGTTSEEFGRFLRSEVARWAKVVKQSGARID